MHKPVIASLIVIAATVPSFAQNINEQQARLQNKINADAASGALSPEEAARMQSKFNRIQQLENNLRSNGLNSAERAHLESELNELNGQIRRESRDGNNRAGGGFHNGNGGFGNPGFNNGAAGFGHNGPGFPGGPGFGHNGGPGFAGGAGFNGAPQFGNNPGFNGGANGMHNGFGGQFASPQFGGNGINAEQANLQEMINRGVSSGRLSSTEAAALQAKFNRISAVEGQMRNNGLRPDERMRLQSELEQLRGEIRQQAHDRNDSVGRFGQNQMNGQNGFGGNNFNNGGQGQNQFRGHRGGRRWQQGNQQN